MMRRTACLFILCLLQAGCFRVVIYAPEGPPVRLLSRDEKTDVLRVRRTWYAVLGVVAMEKYMPNEIIASEKFEEVRVRVTDTIPDALYGLFNTVVLQVGILAQTYEVLGNRAASPPAPSSTPQGSPAPAGPN